MHRKSKTPKAVAAAKGVDSNRAEANATSDDSRAQTSRKPNHKVQLEMAPTEPDWDGPILWEYTKPRCILSLRERRFKGRRFLDLRERSIYVPDRWTQAGVTIPFDQLEGLAAALLNFRPS